MNKEKIYELLNEKGISYEKVEHDAVFNMKELEEIKLPFEKENAKNLFIRDDKKKNYYLITVKGNKSVDLKKFRKTLGTRPLRFASSEELLSLMKLEPGSVTPFGLLNDIENQVKFYLDSNFLKESGKIACHPNDNRATVFLETKDLIKIIEEYGNKVNIIDI